MNVVNLVNVVNVVNVVNLVNGVNGVNGPIAFKSGAKVRKKREKEGIRLRNRIDTF